MNRRSTRFAPGQRGELLLEVELGKAKVPTEERFRELLDRAIRIDQINAKVNPR